MRFLALAFTLSIGIRKGQKNAHSYQHRFAPRFLVSEVFWLPGAIPRLTATAHVDLAIASFAIFLALFS